MLFSVNLRRNEDLNRFTVICYNVKLLALNAIASSISRDRRLFIVDFGFLPNINDFS